MTKKLSLRPLDPTFTAPHDPQSTWAHSPGSEGELDEGGCTPWEYLAYIVLDDGIPPVKALLPDALKDLGGAVGMGLEHPDNGGLKGIALAWALNQAAFAEVVFLDLLCDGARIEGKRSSNLSGLEALLLKAVSDLGEELKVDHERTPAIFLKTCPMGMGRSMGGLVRRVSACTAGSRGST
jgi:hypothetical protein